MQVSEPKNRCYNCDEELVFDVKIGRRDMCPNCHSYLHCCKNCEFWDPNVHNQCAEQRSEFIRDREEGNFCLYFTFKDTSDDAGNEAEEAKARLKNMFGGSSGTRAKAPQTQEDAMTRLNKLFKD
jgi:hypothetical protein